MTARKSSFKVPADEPRVSRPVPRVPEDSKPIRVDLPLACEACDSLKKG